MNKNLSAGVCKRYKLMWINYCSIKKETKECRSSRCEEAWPWGDVGADSGVTAGAPRPWTGRECEKNMPIGQ